MKSVGKVFEDNWKASVPDNVLYYRPPDSAQSFGGSSNLRFSSKSPCDCFLYDGRFLYMLELKTVGTKSISFERDKNDHGVIHIHQIDNLERFSQFKNVIAGFILDFRLSEKTYFVHINDFMQMINKIDKKSFNESDLNGLCYPIEIKKRKLRVNWRYDIDNLLMSCVK